MALAQRHHATSRVAEDLAMAQGDLAPGEAGHLGIVRHHDDGVAVAVQVGEEARDDLLVGGVEIPGRFIGQKDRRVIDEGAGDADALLLAARELRGKMLGAGSEADALQRLAGLAVVRHGVEVLGQHHVFKR